VAFRKTEHLFVDPESFEQMDIIDTGISARTGNYNTAGAKLRVRKKMKAQVKKYLERKG